MIEFDELAELTAFAGDFSRPVEFRRGSRYQRQRKLRTMIARPKRTEFSLYKVTEQIRQEILARRQAGETLRSIATSFDLSRSYVHAVCKTAGVVCPVRHTGGFSRLTPQQQQETLARRATGESCKSIAESYGVLPSVIHRLLRKKAVQRLVEVES